MSKYVYEITEATYSESAFSESAFSEYAFSDESSDYEDDVNTQILSEKSRVLKQQELAEHYGVSNRKLKSKIDLHVVPPFALIFVVAYLNRSSLGILQIEGVYPSLHMNQLMYFMSYLAFFVPYAVLQFFSNIFLGVVKPHFWIAVGVAGYGTITLCSGFSKSYVVYLVLQFFHGLFQSGSETALFYILGQYYTRRESQKRFSFIYSCSCLASLLATVIAYAVDNTLAGRHGLESWRWIQIIEGAVTLASSIVLFFTIPDFPEGATFLHNNEAVFLMEKLQLFQGNSGYDIKVASRDYFKMIVDPMVYVPAFIAFGVCYATFTYSFFEAVFMFQIIGGGSSKANEYSIYPWVVGFVWCNLCAAVSDMLGQHKLGVLVVNILLALVSTIIISTKVTTEIPDRVKYAACFMAVMGSFGAAPILFCWTNNNLGGHLRKSFGISLQTSFGSLGGIFSIFSFYSQDTHYYRGFATAIVCLSLSLIASFVYVWLIHRANLQKRTKQYKREFFALSNNKQVLLGDHHPALDYIW